MGFTKYFYSGRIIVYDNFKLALCLQSKVATTSILQMFLNLLPEEFMYLRDDIESLHREMGQQFSLRKSERYEIHSTKYCIHMRTVHIHSKTR